MNIYEHLFQWSIFGKSKTGAKYYVVVGDKPDLPAHSPGEMRYNFESITSAGVLIGMAY